MALMRLATKTAAVYVIIGGRASPMARLGKFGRLPAGRRTEPGVFNEVCAIFAHNQALLAWQRLSNLLIPSHSHSIISEPPNGLFCLAFCASRRTDTVGHTVEMDRWRAIDPDRSRTHRSICCRIRFFRIPTHSGPGQVYRQARGVLPSDVPPRKTAGLR